ncbi:MAG: heavy-metal-associated domain-containing protein [Microbacterium sp.]
MSLQGQDLGLKDVSAPAGGGCCGGGSCGCGDASASTGGHAHGGVTGSLLVNGMTCGHCVSAVTTELSELDGVTGVDVDLNPGAASRVTIHSISALDPEAVSAAIEDAGYTVAR